MALHGPARSPCRGCVRAAILRHPLAQGKLGVDASPGCRRQQGRAEGTSHLHLCPSCPPTLLCSKDKAAAATCCHYKEEKTHIGPVYLIGDKGQRRLQCLLKCSLSRQPPSPLTPLSPLSPPAPTSSSRLHAASRCSSSLQLRVQSLVTLRMSSLRARLAEPACSSCSRSMAFTCARLALLGRGEGDGQVLTQGEPLCPPPDVPSPLLFLLQAGESTLQVMAVLCVLVGELGECQVGPGRGERACPCRHHYPCPGIHLQPLLLQLCRFLQQLLLQL